MNGSYKYYAFISYKREDAHYAKWLQKKLQNYRLPVSLQKTINKERIRLNDQSGTPKRLSPIFRDQSDLVPGILDQSLHNAVAESKYLIVICSRNAFRNPTYLDLEIRSFLETGHRVDQIIPLIIDEDCPHPELECFPPELQKLNREYGLLGVNFKDSPEKTAAGRRNDAFLKIVAHMLGVQMPEVKNLDKLRRRRNLLLSSAAGLMALIALVWGLRYYDQHYRPHIAYYRDYVVQNNVAQGIYPLTEAETSRIPQHYRFTTVDDLVRTVEYRNSAGSLVDPEPTVLNEGAARIEYTYQGREPETATYYSYMGELLVCHNFWDSGTRISFSRASGSSAASFASAGGSGFSLEKTMISKYLQTMEDGRISLRLFAQGDHYTPTHNGDTMSMSNAFLEDIQPEERIYGYLLTYDDLGRIAHLTYVSDAQGSPNGTQDGINTVTYQYDDATGILVLESNFDIYGNPAPNSEGWASRQILLDDRGYPVSEVYLDAFGDPTITADGYAALYYEYDGTFRVLKGYLDENMAPTTVDGCAVERCTRDDTGLIVGYSYWDAQGEPALNTSLGCYGWKQEYASDTDFTKIWLDADGNPMPGLSSVQTRTFYETADDGQRLYVVQTGYLGENGEPVTDGPAYTRDVFDEHIYRYYETTHHRADGSLICGEDGIARKVMEHSPLGDMEAIVTYDEEGRQLERTEYHYNHQGYLVKITSCIGSDPANTSGAAVERSEDGSILSHRILDAQGALTENAYGIAITQYGYDPQGRLCSITYLNKDGLPVYVDGCVHLETEYDAWGNILVETNWGLRLDSSSSCRYVPVNSLSDGYARREYDYDDQGNKTGMWLYSANEQGGLSPVVVDSLGIAGMSVEYDDRGNPTLICYYGAQGDTFVPANSEVSGIARMEASYDQNNNCICEAFFGTDGENYYPIVPEDYGYSRLEYFYNADGSFSGGLMVVEEPGSPREEYRFDQDGNITDYQIYP